MYNCEIPNIQLMVCVCESPTHADRLSADGCNQKVGVVVTALLLHHYFISVCLPDQEDRN